MHFILDLKGICSISDAQKLLEMETLSERRKAARLSLLMKIISGDSESSAIIRECFTDLVTNQHDHFTRLSQSSVPFTLKSNLLPFHNSYVPRTTRDLRLSTVQLFASSSKRSPLLPLWAVQGLDQDTDTDNNYYLAFRISRD